jgi:hypothetical protein
MAVRPLRVRLTVLPHESHLLALVARWPGQMSFADDLSPEERATVELATQLVDSGNLHPLIARLRDGDIGPESARDALRILGQLDPDLLVQITLDGLITAYLEDPGLAYQPRRAVRGEQSVQIEPGGSAPRNTLA